MPNPPIPVARASRGPAQGVTGLLLEIWDKLPEYPITKLDPNDNTTPDTSTHDSSKAAEQTEPPRFWVEYNVETLIDFYIVFVENQVKSSQTLKQMHCLSRDPSARHAHESDVVRTSDQHILLPGSHILWEWQNIVHPKYGMFYVSEFTWSKVRCDVTYYRDINHQERAKQDKMKFKTNFSIPYCVIEYKKRGTIREEEFKQALKESKKPTELDKREDYDIWAQGMENPNKPTLFSGNSLKLMKQASMYAIRHRTKYVALCDWDYMLLIYFGKANWEENTVGGWCYMTIIPWAESGFTRPAYYGHVASAFLDSLRSKHRDPRDLKEFKGIIPQE